MSRMERIFSIVSRKGSVPLRAIHVLKKGDFVNRSKEDGGWKAAQYRRVMNWNGGLSDL